VAYRAASEEAANDALNQQHSLTAATRHTPRRPPTHVPLHCARRTPGALRRLITVGHGGHQCGGGGGSGGGGSGSPLSHLVQCGGALTQPLRPSEHVRSPRTPRALELGRRRAPPQSLRQPPPHLQSHIQCGPKHSTLSGRNVFCDVMLCWDGLLTVKPVKHDAQRSLHELSLIQA